MCTGGLYLPHIISPTIRPYNIQNIMHHVNNAFSHWMLKMHYCVQHGSGVQHVNSAVVSSSFHMLIISLGLYYIFLWFFSRSYREYRKTYAGSMQQQPRDGRHHVPGWRWHRRGAQHQFWICGGFEQQSSTWRVNRSFIHIRNTYPHCVYSAL